MDYNGLGGDTVELKPCPFCGEKAWFSQTSFVRTDSAFQLGFDIECKGCGVKAPGSRGFIRMSLGANGDLNIWHDDREKAAEAWNRRTADAERDENQ